MPLTERDINIPHLTQTQTPPTHKTPPAPSKLPRPTATPNTAPASSKWTSRVADQAASIDRAASAMRHAHTVKRSTPVIEPAPKAYRIYQPEKDKPLPQEKALPPRPIARLSAGLSPSKSSRSLIDACDQPLHITSISGDKHEWPALRPQASRSASATPAEMTQTYQTAETSINRPTSASEATDREIASELAADSRTKQQRASKSSSHSRASSYVSATEDSSQATQSHTPSREGVGNIDSHIIDQRHRSLSIASTNNDLPTRQASLRSRISQGNLITPSNGSKHQVMTLTDFTRAETASPTSTASRTHSPSPASFSRPRPGSMSNGVTNIRSMKTASRIPIPDSKKATMVEVRKDQSPTSNMPRNAGTALPTFGSRRLASPEALKILENGKVRRQMKRAPTDASSNPPMRALTQDSTARTTPPLSHSVDNSPEYGAQMDSSRRGSLQSSHYDDETASTPSDRSQHFPASSHRNSKLPSNPPPSPDIDVYGMFNDDMLHVARAPPQTSPFVAPLQTIPSEAVLTVDANDFNEKTREELVRTLTHLEGKGSPPKFDVDNETLLHMFGHLKKGLERNPHNSSALVQNAAAAEKYLAMRGSSILEVKGLGQTEWTPDNKLQRTQANDENAQPDSTIKKQTFTSKWSNSTPSDKATSTPSDDVSAGLRPPSLLKPRAKSPSLPEPSSIGYPSRIPSRISPNIAQAGDEAATISSIPSRRSSPTLSKRNPGSVRHAREGLQIGGASFARTTASAESRKVARTPNASNRTFSIPETAQRGRMTLSEKPRSRSEGLAGSKPPRSRSKSRYVLDKINGLFSGKRDKKSIAIPPIPRIEESGVPVREIDRSTSSSSPGQQPTRASQLPKMPSRSPLGPTVPRTNSRTTMRTDDTTLVDRISMKEETQCVQVLSEHLVGKARGEMNPQRKERLLTFAKVLNDSLISVREAAISAETAQHAAKSAQVSYEMTQKSLALVQRLATTMARNGTGSYNKR